MKMRSDGAGVVAVARQTAPLVEKLLILKQTDGPTISAEPIVHPVEQKESLAMPSEPTVEPVVRKELLTKIEKLHAMRVKLRSAGASVAEVAKQTSPLLEEVKALKQRSGFAKLEVVAPVQMQAKVPASEGELEMTVF